MTSKTLVPSRYNHEVMCDGRRYLYNLLSVGLVELPGAGSLTEICETHPEYESQLMKMGFVVEYGYDEFDKYQYYFDSSRFGKAARTFKLELIPTYGCNLRCPYCYQGQGKDSQKMGIEGAERVLRFLERELSGLVQSNAIDVVQVHLFGGEPMMDKDAIVRFCDGSSAIAKRIGRRITYAMTTNLTLLDENMMDLIRKFEIVTQVTIDGTQPYHDKKRVTASGVGTYNHIIQNLMRMKNEGLTQYVNIRINVDNETISTTENVLDSLDGLYDSIYFSVVVHHAGANDCHSKLCVPESSFSKYVTTANDIFAKKGLPVHRPFGKRPPCALVTPNKYFVDCKYDVYGCDCLINHPECKIGVIDPDGRLVLNAEYYSQLNTALTNNKKCKACKWAPACGGGCPATKYISDKRCDGKLECQCIIDDESLDTYLIDYIRRSIKAVRHDE